MKLYYKILLLLIVVTNFSCNTKIYSIGEYIAWVESEEYPLIYQKEINGYTIALKYLPYQYICLKNTDSVNVNKINLNKKDSKVSVAHFLLRITHQSKVDIMKLNANDSEGYSRMIQYFSFDIMDDFELSNSEQSAKCNLVHFERNYGLSPNTNLLLEFDELFVGDEGLLFTYNDKILRIGRINIQMPTSDLKVLENYHIDPTRL